MKANVAKMTVENHGVRSLEITINGQGFSLNQFFMKGQCYDNTKFGQFSDFLADRGWGVNFTGKATPLTVKSSR